MKKSILMGLMIAAIAIAATSTSIPVSLASTTGPEDHKPESDQNGWGEVTSELATSDGSDDNEHPDGLIETWRGFIEKLPTDEDEAILTKLLNDCYKYSLAINNHAQMHPFASEVFNHVAVIDTA